MSTLRERLAEACALSNRSVKEVQILPVTKNWPVQAVHYSQRAGFSRVGENRVQEALEKKSSVEGMEWDLIGHLQSNKAKDAVKIFDYIHSLDNQKLADSLAKHQRNLNKNIQYFIQVNIGNEIQKSGISVSELDPFYNYCVNEINLKIIGLMVIPPNDNNSEKYFKSLNELNKSLALNDLSMGMSSDYLDAIKHEATFVRIGSSIFGARS